MGNTRYLVILFIFLCKSQYSFAWGNTGHKAIGIVALHYLDAKTKDSIRAYLGNVGLDSAGMWMDQMRSDPAYDYMKPWHYIYINKGETYKPGTEENVINELNKVIDQLKHRNLYSKEQTTTNIKILAHLVEDLHMPLHTGYASDTEGLAVKVKFDGHTTSLHWVWDEEIIQKKHINADTCLALLSKYTKTEIAGMDKTDILRWMNESHAYLGNVYDFKGDVIDDKYISKNLGIIEMRLSLSGIRLARLLNDIFQS